MRIGSDQLQSFSQAILVAAGATSREAAITAEHLVAANLAGHDSHGTMRILQYLREIREGRIVPGAVLKIVSEWNSGLLVDASGVFGQVACHDAMRHAIVRAQDASLAAVAVRHSNHSGRLGTYVEQAAAANMIGVVMANGGGAGQWVAPFGGCERRLSTNPLAIGAPSSGAFPFILDISTSVAPEGKIRDYRQRNQRVPAGWLVDHQGKSTDDPAELYADPAGALLPFGGSSGHKGFGLAFMVDVFAGVLTQAGYPRTSDADAGQGTGLFMIAIDVQRFATLEEFLPTVREMADYIKSSKPAAGFKEVLVPGEFEYQQRQRRTEEGIEIPSSVWIELNQVAGQLGVTQLLECIR